MEILTKFDGLVWLIVRMSLSYCLPRFLWAVSIPRGLIGWRVMLECLIETGYLILSHASPGTVNYYKKLCLKNRYIWMQKSK